MYRLERKKLYHFYLQQIRLTMQKIPDTLQKTLGTIKYNKITRYKVNI